MTEGLRVHYASDQELSGYGVAARRLVLGLESLRCAVSWTPLTWDRDDPLWRGTGPSEIGLDRLRRQADDERPDVVIVHMTPEVAVAAPSLRLPGVPFVVHTVWEHDVLQAHWPGLLNEADAVVVPTRWNAGAFRAAGVRVPVLVVPHAHSGAFDDSDDEWLNDVCDPGTLLVHSVSSWRDRKATGNTVDVFARAFTAEDDAVLALLTSHHISGDVPAPPGPEHRRYDTSWSVAQILGRQPAPPRVQLLTERITDRQLAGLHARSDAWLSLPHAEGWDLGCFDAAVAGCPVITTGFGGPLEYLDAAASWLIPGRLVEVPTLPGAHWIEPDLDAAVDALRAVAADPTAARERAAAQARRLREEYAPQVVAAGLLAELRGAGLLN